MRKGIEKMWDPWEFPVVSSKPRGLETSDKYGPNIISASSVMYCG